MYNKTLKVETNIIEMTVQETSNQFGPLQEIKVANGHMIVIVVIFVVLPASLEAFFTVYSAGQDVSSTPDQT